MAGVRSLSQLEKVGLLDETMLMKKEAAHCVTNARTLAEDAGHNWYGDQI
jgi:hypothetical protein